MAVGVIVAALAVGGDGPAMALINESSSLARGLYVRTGERVSPGAVVAVAQSEAARPYLERLSMPADLLLLKRVGASSSPTSDSRKSIRSARPLLLILALHSKKSGESPKLMSMCQPSSPADSGDGKRIGKVPRPGGGSQRPAPTN